MFTNEPLILHIETATPVCSVAVSRGRKLLSFSDHNQPQSHAQHLTLLIEKVLAEAQITAKHLHGISLSMGPGSYTGLRIGTSVTKGMAYTLNIPVIGVSSLESLATGFREEFKPGTQNSLLVPMIDARRMEVYLSVFSARLEWILPQGTAILHDSYLQQLYPGKHLYFFGTGAFKIHSLPPDPRYHIHTGFNASARYMTSPCMDQWDKKEFLDPAYFEPDYLKEFQATTPRKKLL